MSDSIRFYDRALQRLTRRELLNIAWKLGLAAVAQPILSTRAFAQPLFRTFPFPLGVASALAVSAPVRSSTSKARRVPGTLVSA